MTERRFVFHAWASALMLAAASAPASETPTEAASTVCRTCLQAAVSADGARAVVHDPLAAAYRIAEPDLLDVIEALAASPWGRRRHREEIVQAKRRLARWADEPEPASRLPKARQPQLQFLHAPFDVEHPAFAPLREVFAGYSRRLIFIDAGDSAEQAYVLSALDQDPAVRVVALAGSLAALREARPQARFYFDQGGALRRLLKLRAHPSIVRLTGAGAEVRAVVLESGGRPAPENDEPVRLPDAQIPVPADVRAAALEAQRLLKMPTNPISEELPKVRP